MPNWCENTLIVEGDPAIVRQFKERVKGKETDLSLAKLHPMPEELKDTVSPGAEPNWYDWSIDHWGTKWDVQAELVLDAEGYLEYVFMSAWSPPVPWLKKVAKDYPALAFRLKYEEGNEGFMGMARAEKGEVKDRCIDTT